MLTLKKIVAPLAAFALPVLLATSSLAQDKMMGHKMDGGKMMTPKMGGKMMGHGMMSVKGLVPVKGPMPSQQSLMGAKVVKATTMMGATCYDVKFKSGKVVQMCKPADKKMLMMHMNGTMHPKMHSGKMMSHKMSGKM